MEDDLLLQNNMARRGVQVLLFYQFANSIVVLCSRHLQMLPLKPQIPAMSALLNGKLKGVFHDSRGKFARLQIQDDGPEIEIPISDEQFHSLPLKNEVKILIQIVL